MTRFAAIKLMDIDELVDYFMGPICKQMENCPTIPISCHDCVKSWLEEEVH